MCNSCNSYGTNRNSWYRNNSCNSCGTNNAKPANNGGQTQQANNATNPFNAGNTNAKLGGWKKQANGAQTKDYNMGCSNVTLWGDNDGDDNVQVNNGVMTGNTMSSDEGKYEKLRDYGDVMQIGDKYYMPPSQKEMDDLAKANGGCASKMWTELKGDDLDKYLKLKNGETVVMGEDKAQDAGTAVLGGGEKPLPSRKEAEQILNNAIEEGANKAIADPVKREEISRALSREAAGTKFADEYNKELTEVNNLLQSVDEGLDTLLDDADDLIDDESDTAYDQAQSEAGIPANDLLSLSQGSQITINPDKIEAAENFYNSFNDVESTMAKALKASIDVAKEKKKKEIEEAKNID